MKLSPQGTLRSEYLYTFVLYNCIHLPGATNPRLCGIATKALQVIENTTGGEYATQDHEAVRSHFRCADHRCGGAIHRPGRSASAERGSGANHQVGRDLSGRRSGHRLAYPPGGHRDGAADPGDHPQRHREAGFPERRRHPPEHHGHRQSAAQPRQPQQLRPERRRHLHQPARPGRRAHPGSDQRQAHGRGHQRPRRLVADSRCGSGKHRSTQGRRLVDLRFRRDRRRHQHHHPQQFRRQFPQRLLRPIRRRRRRGQESRVRHRLQERARFADPGRRAGAGRPPTVRGADTRARTCTRSATGAPPATRAASSAGPAMPCRTSSTRAIPG